MLGPFSTEFVQRDGHSTLRFSGELDLAVAADAQAVAFMALRERDGSVLVLDLEELGFCDSSGLHALIEIQNESSRLGRKLILDRPSSQLSRLLELVGIRDQFSVRDDFSHADGRKAST
jgi:anti-sigma B factor antagonist